MNKNCKPFELNCRAALQTIYTITIVNIHYTDTYYHVVDVIDQYGAVPVGRYAQSTSFAGLRTFLHKAELKSYVFLRRHVPSGHYARNRHPISKAWDEPDTQRRHRR